ncbi:hypothetical protein HYZ76_01475 [Candidatus Falkowbacteria bacterium]|nr:hypothetical protein [Candidatus Falkowbacteria bacterium]
MPKDSPVTYVCSNCDSQFPQWHNRCPECEKENTLKPHQPETG